MICSKFNIADGMRQMFDPFERVARAHHICPCCERPFSAEEEDEFVKKVVILFLFVILSVGGPSSDYYFPGSFFVCHCSNV